MAESVESTPTETITSGYIEVAGREVSFSDIVADYRIAFQSRQASLLGRREVLSGKAKFGIFGDGKELAQVCMARSFANGDIRSGYYRDQTFMFAKGMSSVRQFFAQLYAITSVEAEPASAGRQMNGHFATRFLSEDGSWKSMTDGPNCSADISPTGSQMPRLVGLAYASRLYRELPELATWTDFSIGGNEVAYGTIGNATCAEGMFWESVNAIGVLRSPALISIWDDGYGISVPNEFQVTKANVGELLQGFQRTDDTRGGYDIRTVKAWDYLGMMQAYFEASDTARRDHTPQIIHVIEVTQPQGHSTSGSHERYKSKERLQWEVDFDCLKRMRDWMIDVGIVSAEHLDQFESEDVAYVRRCKEEAWTEYLEPIKTEIGEFAALVRSAASGSSVAEEVESIVRALEQVREPFRRDTVVAAHRVLVALRTESAERRAPIIAWRGALEHKQRDRYSSHLFSQGPKSPLLVTTEIAPVFTPESKSVNGSEVLNACFDLNLSRYPNLLAFGEDVGQLGDVNQAFLGLQEKFGKLRVSDTGIREVTILGQAIGLAMRGLRPIAEIQYLDYLLYALQLMSDDLATVQWRTKGGQKAPVIVRTRGHRLEGIWHAGSPMAGIIHLVRGVHVCVPRNMTQAAAFYNTLLEGDDPALVIEVLNGYRLKERVPENIGEIKLPLGLPEVIQEGTDITVVTYGACCRVATDAATMLAKVGISVEVVDVRTLLPFDRWGVITSSLSKTNRLLVLDEDVPGGASSYILQQVLEVQGGYKFLDSAPRTLAAQEHRPAYGTDGAYWSKPEAEHVFDTIYAMMHEANPRQYPLYAQ